MTIQRIWSAGACLLLSLGALCASAQDFPNRPITLIMPYAPGGPGDAITRVFAGALQKNLKQQVVVDNPSGASGTIGTARVARSKPDGYTLLMALVSISTIPVADEVLGRPPSFSLQQLRPMYAKSSKI